MNITYHMTHHTAINIHIHIHRLTHPSKIQIYKYAKVGKIKVLI